MLYEHIVYLFPPLSPPTDPMHVLALEDTIDGGRTYEADTTPLPLQLHMYVHGQSPLL